MKYRNRPLSLTSLRVVGNSKGYEVGFSPIRENRLFPYWCSMFFPLRIMPIEEVHSFKYWFSSIGESWLHWAYASKSHWTRLQRKLGWSGRSAFFSFVIYKTFVFSFHYTIVFKAVKRILNRGWRTFSSPYQISAIQTQWVFTNSFPFTFLFAARRRPE